VGVFPQISLGSGTVKLGSASNKRDQRRIKIHCSSYCTVHRNVCRAWGVGTARLLSFVDRRTRACRSFPGCGVG